MQRLGTEEPRRLRGWLPLGRVTNSCASLSEWGQWATGTKWAPPGDRRESLSWTAGPGFFLGIFARLDTTRKAPESARPQARQLFSEWELEAATPAASESEIELSGTSTWAQAAYVPVSAVH